MPESQAALLRRPLLSWFAASQRDLPWRRDADPYRIWVSEVMLQQTTVKAVLPRYERFLERFPTVEALAAASEEAVLGEWSGLGYYHRARNLRRGAEYVVREHGGVFPRSLSQALAVPGVGRYTAGAILSIAHGLPLPVVDGNVKRVLSRLLAQASLTEGEHWHQAAMLLEPSQPGDWNQAVMELGATVCTPRAPRCEECPLAFGCRAFALGEPERFPAPRPRRDPVDVTVAVALLEQDGRVLLVRRPRGRLMGGMWELPQTSLDSNGLPDLVSEMQGRYALAVSPGPLVATARHTITYRRIRVEGYRARLTQAPPHDPDRLRWVSPHETGVATSSLTRKLLRVGLAGDR